MFEKHKGARLHKQFVWITNHHGLWWDGVSWKPSHTGECSNCCKCSTLRAFRKHLKRHPEIKGKAILVSRFIGYDIYACGFVETRSNEKTGVDTLGYCIEESEGK